MGFGIAINDDDNEGSRDSQWMWGTEAGDLWMRSDTFPQVQLIDETVSGGDPGDFDGDGAVGTSDINALIAAIKDPNAASSFDVDGSGTVDDADRISWVKDVKRTWIGDANLDGEFNSTDFVNVFQAGLFESGNMAGWEQGDWNGDMVFDSGDFVAAFQDGGFENGPVPPAAVPEPASASLMLLGLLASLGLIRRRS